MSEQLAIGRIAPRVFRVSFDSTTLDTLAPQGDYLDMVFLPDELAPRPDAVLCVVRRGPQCFFVQQVDGLRLEDVEALAVPQLVAVPDVYECVMVVADCLGRLAAGNITWAELVEVAEDITEDDDPVYLTPDEVEAFDAAVDATADVADPIHPVDLLMFRALTLAPALRGLNIHPIARPSA